MIRRIALSAVALVGLAGWVWSAEPASSSRQESTALKADRSFGTAVQWESNLASAAKKADRQDKLVMLLAVAGHFEDPFFT
jgi:hypothetical protein